MKLSCITGEFITDEREVNKEYDGEKFYIYTFKVEDGLTIPVQVSEYISVPIGTRVKLTGHLATLKKHSETRGKIVMFTFFDAKLIEPYDVNGDTIKEINCEGVVVYIYDMQLTRGGAEKITLVVKEKFDGGRVGIIHYKAIGKLARQLHSKVHVKDNVVGTGILRRKTESFEVLLNNLQIVDKEVTQ